jgi:hypothetical protein
MCSDARVEAAFAEVDCGGAGESGRPCEGPTTTNAMIATSLGQPRLSRDAAGQATCWILRPDVHRGTLSIGQAGGLLAMAIPTREPFLAYLLVRAAMLRRRAATPIGASRLEAHAHALDLLADLIRALPDDDKRLLMFSRLAVRDGQFVPGASTEHGLSQFAGSSREACDRFLTSLVQVARDDALGRPANTGSCLLGARAEGFSQAGGVWSWQTKAQLGV